MKLIKARVEPMGISASLLGRLQDARWIETPGYPRSDVAENKRDRYQRETTVATAAESDLLVLLIDGSREDHNSDVAFTHSWDRWFHEHPQREVPPTLVVITGTDRPEFGGRLKAAAGPTTDLALRESLVRAQIDSLLRHPSTHLPRFHGRRPGRAPHRNHRARRADARPALAQSRCARPCCVTCTS